MENNTERKIVQYVMQGGLALSVLLMLLGLAINIIQSSPIVSIQLQDLFTTQLSSGTRILGWGILLLSIIPALRVFTLVYLWGKEKDWKYVCAALAVLLTLTISVLSGTTH